MCGIGSSQSRRHFGQAMTSNPADILIVFNQWPYHQRGSLHHLKINFLSKALETQVKLFACCFSLDFVCGVENSQSRCHFGPAMTINTDNILIAFNPCSTFCIFSKIIDLGGGFFSDKSACVLSSSKSLILYYHNFHFYTSAWDWILRVKTTFW